MILWQFKGTAWDVKWTLRELSPSSGGAGGTANSSKTLCYYPGLASYVLTKESADATVKFHHDVTMARGFDGLYVDMLTDDWFIGIEDAALSKIQFDCNGDDAADTVLDMQTQWKGWRPYLVEQLRATLGTEKILIANTASVKSLLHNGPS